MIFRYRLFKNDPEIRNLFKQFKNVNIEDLEDSQDLENHAILVMNAIDEAMSNFHQEQRLIEMLLETGKFHLELEDFKPHMFYVRQRSHIVSF